MDISTEAEHFGRSCTKIHEEVPVRLGAHHLGSSNSIINIRNGMNALIIIINATVVGCEESLAHSQLRAKDAQLGLQAQ